MSAFIYHGPLAPESPLYRGRNIELKKLLSWCRYETLFYTIIYGGRQCGKTSLAYRLMFELEKVGNIRTCHIDFQNVPGATSRQVYSYVAQKAARSLSWPNQPNISQSAQLTNFLCQSLGTSSVDRLVVVLEELGALPQATREDLANVLRGLFTNRHEAGYEPLTKLMIVLTGSIELYDLAATQVSTLFNICEAIYLSDLSNTDAVELISSGLSKIDDMAALDCERYGQAIYDRVRGQPYLTQRLGALLADSLGGEKSFSADNIDNAFETLHDDDVLLRHLHGALHEYHLLEECEPLLRQNVKFSRNDESMARLELLGIATKGDRNNWVVRNSLFANEINAWLNNTRQKNPGSLTPSEYEQSVFISYAWREEREQIVNQIDEALQKRGMKVIRDKRDLGYKGSISEFMERIGRGHCVIVVISDKYLRSPNCMFELVEIADAKQFHDRIFPVVLNDANIYDPIKRIEYVKYWENKRAELADAIKTLDPANLAGIRDDMDLYDRIRDKISGLTSTLKDMNTLTPDMHRDSDFHDLYTGIEKRMKGNSSSALATK